MQARLTNLRANTPPPDDYCYTTTRMTVDFRQLAAQSETILARLEAGEAITILREGVPMARVVPFEYSVPPKPGTGKGQIWMSDDFNAPLPDEVLDEFYTEDDNLIGPKCRD